MKNGICIPAAVVRATVVVLTAAAVTALAFNASDIVRYIKIERM
jgi:hypothetical protein